MASASTRKQAVPGALLSEQAHQQVKEYIELAEKSGHADIRATALAIAKQTSDAEIELQREFSKHQRKQQARVSSASILWLVLVGAVSVAGASWYAYLHYD